MKVETVRRKVLDEKQPFLWFTMDWEVLQQDIELLNRLVETLQKVMDIWRRRILPRISGGIWPVDSSVSLSDGKDGIASDSSVL